MFRNFRKMTIKRKLLSSGLGILVMTIALTVSGWQGFHAVISNTLVSKNVLEGTMYLQMLLRGVNESLITDGTPASVKTVEESVLGFDRIRKAILSGERVEIDQGLIHAMRGDWPTIEKEVASLLLGKIGLSETDSVVRCGKIIRSVNSLLTNLQKEAERSHQRAETVSHRTPRLLCSISIAIMLSATGIFYGLYRRILPPLSDFANKAQAFSNGDLAVKMDDKGEDEVACLARSFNAMCAKIGEVVARSETLSQKLSTAASEQAASLEETSSSLEEMAAMTRQNASHTAEASRLMTSAREVIHKVNASMNELMGSMNAIADAGAETQKIVKTIDEIAFQTNLLALNAAVEAARAGEAGSGFAVVAGEVRTLATRAAEAARNTAGMMEDIVRKIKQSEQLVMLAHDEFRQVHEGSAQVADLMGDIAAASREQSQGIDQINQAAAEISRTTMQHTAGAEELAFLMSIFKGNGERLQGLVR